MGRERRGQTMWKKKSWSRDGMVVWDRSEQRSKAERRREGRNSQSVERKRGSPKKVSITFPISWGLGWLGGFHVWCPHTLWIFTFARYARSISEMLLHWKAFVVRIRPSFWGHWTLDAPKKQPTIVGCQYERVRTTNGICLQQHFSLYVLRVPLPLHVSFLKWLDQVIRPMHKREQRKAEREGGAIEEKTWSGPYFLEI